MRIANNTNGSYITNSDIAYTIINNAGRKTYLKDSSSLVYIVYDFNSLSKSNTISLHIEEPSNSAKIILSFKQKFFIFTILLLSIIFCNYSSISFSWILAYIINTAFICKSVFLIIKSYNLIEKQYE